MKRCKFALAALLLSSAALHAQEGSTPTFEVGLNYSGVHVNSATHGLNGTGNGGSGYFEYNLNHMVGMVADLGGYANTRTGVNDKVMTYLFGPRFNWRHSRLNPYVQFLFGGAYLWPGPDSNPKTGNSFAYAAGGGVDYKLTDHIALKPFQVEYVATQFNSAGLGGAGKDYGDHQNDIRWSAGVVYRFGEK